MRNLIVFLARNYFFLLFLLLEAISVLVLVRHNAYQRAETVTATSEIAGKLFATRNQMTGYFNLREQNEMLSKQIAELRLHQMPSLTILNARRVTRDDTIYKQRYSFIDARVIDNTVTRRNNYLILNCGSNQGVTKDMGVIGPQGIIGIVREVSPDYCTVMSVLHKESKISAALKKDGTFGQLLWEGYDYRTAVLKEVPTHVKLKAGDTLLTSGFGDAFPKGILVGTVVSFEKKAGEKTYTIQVLLSTDFRRVDHVNIVHDLVKNELDSLRLKLPAEEDGY
jgi:rod shape-determining protein MreC